MEKLNRELLDNVKKAFVSMPAGSDPAAGPGPVAGGGMLTQAQAAPMGMDPAAMGGAPMDPAMMGGDPAAMGGAPMDPAMMGGDPAAMGMDPAMMGGDPAAMGGAPTDPAAMGGEPMPGQITMSIPEFTELIQVILGAAVEGKAVSAGAGAAKEKAAGGKAGVEAKLDMLIDALGINAQQ